MKIIDLKYQSATPSDPSPNTLGVYASSGTPGLIFTLTSGGDRRQIGITFSGALEQSAIKTGMGTLDTGFFFGGTGVGTQRATGLASPYRWLPVYMSDGTNVAIPAYLLA